MTRTLTTALKSVFCAAAIAACLASPNAQAQVEIIFPPAAYIATAAPVYFEGRPAYWWGGRWYYREGRDWRYYHEEPVFLRERREHERWEPARHYYGRAHWGGYWHR
jgi:hypothetical protein